MNSPFVSHPVKSDNGITFWQFRISALMLFGLTAFEAGAEDSGITSEFGYTLDLVSNVSGGDETASVDLHYLDAAVSADIEELFSLDGVTAFAYAQYTNGNSISDLVGDAQGVSNIESGVEALRLQEFWFRKEFGTSGVSALLGLYDINSEFDGLVSTDFFVQSAHGIGTDIAQTGENGPSIFPVTSLTLKAEAELSDTLFLRGAIADGVPGDPDHPKRTTINLSAEDGTFMIGEGEYKTDEHRLIGGLWRYSADFDRFDGTRGQGNSGFYFGGEYAVGSATLDDPDAAIVFSRIGSANGEINPFGWYVSAGAVWTQAGLNTRFGASVAHAITSDDYRTYTPDAANAETAIEVSADLEANEYLSFQPYAQYILNPGADATFDDALALGIRLSTGITFEE